MEINYCLFTLLHDNEARLSSIVAYLRKLNVVLSHCYNSAVIEPREPHTCYNNIKRVQGHFWKTIEKGWFDFSARIAKDRQCSGIYWRNNDVRRNNHPRWYWCNDALGSVTWITPFEYQYTQKSMFSSIFFCRSVCTDLTYVGFTQYEV
jgi:hypothetical protein